MTFIPQEILCMAHTNFMKKINKKKCVRFSNQNLMNELMNGNKEEDIIYKWDTTYYPPLNRKTRIKPKRKKKIFKLLFKSLTQKK